MRKSIVLPVLIVSLVALFSSFAAVANATWPWPSYTYQLSSSHPGPYVPLGTTVTVTATTTDPKAYSVMFIWVSPSHDYSTGIIPISGGSASSSHTLDEEGEWCVHAIFFDSIGCECFRIVYPVAWRCIKLFVNVVPEIPVVGTAGASIVMALGLAYKMKRKSPKSVAA
jgi:hypothetical protein